MGQSADSPQVEGTFRSELSLHGLAVRGAYRVERQSSDGSREVVAQRVPATPAQVEPSEAVIEPEALPEVVANALGLDEPAVFEAPPVLVYRLVLGVPVLTWEATLALRLSPEPSRETVWVSAMTGRLVDRVENVRSFSRARVFAQNPAVTPQPIEVELTGLDVEGAGAVLEGTRIRSFNCVDAPPEEVAPWHEEGDCFVAHRVFSDEAGDFYVSLPEVVREADNVRADDPYSELSMYYHAEVFLEAMRAWGIEAFRCEPATMVSNFRGLEPSSSAPGLGYTPLDNAFFTDQCDPERGATMLFGQGGAVDFGFDGDVVYHELGHGLVAMLTPDGLRGRQFAADGVRNDAGGINEAIADYFAMAVTGDPDLAEYVGRFWPESDSPFVRSAENLRVCPRDVSGQVHNDGEPVMAALWSARERIGPSLDEVVIETLMELPPDASYEDFTQSLMSVADRWIEQGRWEPDDRDWLRRASSSRGLDDCPRVATEPGDVRTGVTLHVRRRGPATQPFFPGPLQLRYRVPPGATVVEIRVRTRSRGEGPTGVRFLVKRSAQPITFEYDVVAVDEPGDPTGMTGRIREVTFVDGDWDREYEGEPVVGDESVVRVAVRPGETLHVAVANVADEDVVLSSLRVYAPGVDVAQDADEVVGTGTGTGVTVEEVRPGAAVAGGCGCRSSHDGGGGLMSVLFSALLGSIRRRR